MLFFPLINVKMPTIDCILTFMLNGVEHEKSFITSGPGVLCKSCCNVHFCIRIYLSHTLCFCRVTEVVQMLYRIPQGSTIEVRTTCISYGLDQTVTEMSKAELRKRGCIGDYSKIIFLISQRKYKL